jgi:hypothetical protein
MQVKSPITVHDAQDTHGNILPVLNWVTSSLGFNRKRPACGSGYSLQLQSAMTKTSPLKSAPANIPSVLFI